MKTSVLSAGKRPEQRHPAGGICGRRVAELEVHTRDIDDRVVALPQITWEMFVEFLDAGQWYE